MIQNNPIRFKSSYLVGKTNKCESVVSNGVKISRCRPLIFCICVLDDKVTDTCTCVTCFLNCIYTVPFGQVSFCVFELWLCDFSKCLWCLLIKEAEIERHGKCRNKSLEEGSQSLEVEELMCEKKHGKKNAELKYSRFPVFMMAVIDTNHAISMI